MNSSVAIGTVALRCLPCTVQRPLPTCEVLHIYALLPVLKRNPPVLRGLWAIFASIPSPLPHLRSWSRCSVLPSQTTEAIHDSYSWEGYLVARERIAAALPSVAVVNAVESDVSQLMQVGPGPGQGARTAARGSTIGEHSVGRLAGEHGAFCPPIFENKSFCYSSNTGRRCTKQLAPPALHHHVVSSPDVPLSK